MNLKEQKTYLRNRRRKGALFAPIFLVKGILTDMNLKISTLNFNKMKTAFSNKKSGRHKKGRIARKRKMLKAGSFLLALVVLLGCFFCFYCSKKSSSDSSPTPDLINSIDVHINYRKDDPNSWLYGDKRSHTIPPDKEEDPLSTSNTHIEPEEAELEEGHLEVHFMDVGQGDAILVRFIDDNLENGDSSASMLIDAGDNNCGTFVRGYLKKQSIEELDYFVCTHPDEDHIGGASSVVSNVPIKSGVVWGSNYNKKTKTCEKLQKEIFNKTYKYELPEIGKEFHLGSATFMFIAPMEENSDLNSNSLVVKLWYKNNSFLFTGDCEEEEELSILNSSYADFLKSDVLKVAHHGSKTSSSLPFLSLVSPQYAVISCGEKNSYYHPHSATLNSLRSIGCNLFRTDIQGSIVAYADGTEIKWNASACNDWTPGN